MFNKFKTNASTKDEVIDLIKTMLDKKEVSENEIDVAFKVIKDLKN